MLKDQGNENRSVKMNTEKKPIYPIQPWCITEEAFSPVYNYRNETAFHLSNGYIGTRGTFEEGYPFTVEEGLEGNFINGFYDSEEIRYGEWNFGFPTMSQSLLNLPNLKTTHIFVDGEELDMRKGRVTQYSRTLHMKDGVLTRSLVWTGNSGKQVRLQTWRLVSFTRKHIMVQRLQVMPLNFDGSIQLVSVLDGQVENHTRKTNPLVDYGPFGRRLLPDEIGADNGVLFYRGQTKNSGLSMACGSLHVMGRRERETPASSAEGSSDVTICYEQEEACARMYLETQAACGVPVTQDKFMAYVSSRDTEAQNLKGFIYAQLAEAQEAGFPVLLKEQKAYTERFWESADVEIEGDEALNQGIRFNLFHIMQSAGRDGHVGMGAKGLSGEGYEGHYFWDTEIYVLPVFIHTFPELAKELLRYRYATLEEARARARVLGHQAGALYPWRTINGEEASTYVPLGTAQYHINADVGYAFWQYIQVTEDWEFLKECAAEVLCETARVWADVGCFAEGCNNRYCICCVTGPDEYTAFVNNNFYTNLMAREHLRAAQQAVIYFREKDPHAYQELVDRIGLKTEELLHWEKIIENMYIPYDEKRRVYLQDDGFLLRKPWEDSMVPPEKRHLLYENYHPLYLWRQRMCKQADTVLGLYLHSHLFDQEELKRNYDFYQKVTLHHSSLSTCVYGILASRIGYYDQAYKYFYESARMDLDDYHDNFYAGIHAANMAGTWQAIANGFAGLRTGSGSLELSPWLPKGWKSYSLCLQYHGSRIKIRVGKDNCRIELQNAVPVSLILSGQEYVLEEKGDLIFEKI